MDDLSKLGRWIFAVQRHVDHYHKSAEKAYFSKTQVAATCGLLLGRLRRLERIQWPRLAAMAQDMGIGEFELLSIYLPQLQKAGLIEIVRDPQDLASVREIFEHATSAEEALKDTAKMWEAIQPSEVERAVVASLEICSLRPQSLTEYRESLAAQGFGEETIELARQLQRAFRLLEEATFPDLREPYLYNEYLWGNRIHEAARFFTFLPEGVKDFVAQLLEQVRLRQGYPLRHLSGIPDGIIQDAERVGVIDTTEVATQDGSRERFAFTPHLFGVGIVGHPVDAFDEVKLFVASIMYGHQFASVRIKDPSVLVEALIRNGEVGPATPIGRDYPLIETAGIIKVVPSKMYAGRYHMQLVKQDVAKQALEVIQTGFLNRVSGVSQDSASGLYLLNSFQGPEQHRSQLTPVSQASALAKERVMRAMRGEDI